MTKAKTTGMRGKHSPMNGATEAQAEKIYELVEVAKDRDRVYLIEIQHPAYIGPDCAATRGEIVIAVNGGIWYHVTKDGRAY